MMHLTCIEIQFKALNTIHFIYSTIHSKKSVFISPNLFCLSLGTGHLVSQIIIKIMKNVWKLWNQLIFLKTGMISSAVTLKSLCVKKDLFKSTCTHITHHITSWTDYIPVCLSSLSPSHTYRHTQNMVYIYFLKQSFVFSSWEDWEHLCCLESRWPSLSLCSKVHLMLVLAKYLKWTTLALLNQQYVTVRLILYNKH